MNQDYCQLCQTNFKINNQQSKNNLSSTVIKLLQNCVSLLEKQRACS